MHHHVREQAFWLAFLFFTLHGEVASLYCTRQAGLWKRANEFILSHLVHAKLVTITSGAGAKCGKEDKKESTAFHYSFNLSRNTSPFPVVKSDDTPTWLSFFFPFVASPQHYTFCSHVVIP